MTVSELSALDELISAAQEILAAVQSELDTCGFTSEEERKEHIEAYASEIVKLAEKLQSGKCQG